MKVMKRILGLLVVLALSITSINGIQASEAAFAKAQLYYQQKEDKTISYADEILAIEAMGLEVEDSKNGFDISEFLDTDFAFQSAGALGKIILSLCLVDKNPRDINGVDLVALLESYYQEDGSFEKDPNDWVSVGTVPFDVIALKVVKSTLDMSETLAYFTSQQETSGAFGYQANGFHVEYASTAWAMLALEYLGASDASAKAKQFLDSSIDNTLHGWNQYGTLDANNQASVLWPLYELGYSEYQEELQALLSFQCQDGSFGFKSNATSNAMATQQATLALGAKYHGSLIDKAIKEYNETITPPKKEEVIVSKDGLVTVTGKLPIGTTVKVEENKETIAFRDILLNTFKVNVKQMTVFDISLTDGEGKTLQPDTNVSVKVKLPNGFGNDTNLYHEQVDGILANVAVTIEDGYVNFITSSFSKFVFVEKGAVIASTPEKPVEQLQHEITKTNDTTQIYPVLMFAVIGLLGSIVFIEKKKKI